MPKKPKLVIILNEGSELELEADVYTFEKKLREHEDDKNGHFMEVEHRNGKPMFLNVKRILYFYQK